jgi:hypothetical protein
MKATPENHADLAGRLNNLGNKFESLYKRTGKMKALEEVIRKTGSSESAMIALAVAHRELSQKRLLC